MTAAGIIMFAWGIIEGVVFFLLMAFILTIFTPGSKSKSFAPEQIIGESKILAGPGKKNVASKNKRFNKIPRRLKKNSASREMKVRRISINMIIMLLVFPALIMCFSISLDEIE